MGSRVTATIDCDALRHNLARVRALAPDARVMVAVKADGYGHGSARVAGALSDADALAVACIDEAVALRDAGETRPIVLLEGLLSAEEAGLAARLHCAVVVHDDEQLARVADADASAPLDCWLKLDTGMNRLGFDPARASELYERMRAITTARFVGWMTHLACADDPSDGMTATQCARLSKALDGLPGERSIANSAGIVAWPESHADWVRPGLMVYGGSPVRGRSAVSLGLKPAMHVTSRLMSLHSIRAGETVGYGACWRAPRDTRLGVVSVGYGDGLPRSLPADGSISVAVAGRQAPLVGRVSMDMITVDLGELPEAGLGDEVELWGGQIAIDDVATAAGTVAYELMCGLTQRVRFESRD